MTLTLLMRVYNAFQVGLCLYMCWGLWQNPFPNVFRINIPYTQSDEYFIWVHMLSKWVDYMDTLIMLLRKKDEQLSFLHVFHHATIPLVWAFLLYVNAAYSTVTLGAFLNSVIHVIMYSHYFISSFGIRNPFKRVVTQCQISQFMFLIVHSIVALVWEKVIPRYLSYIQFVYQMLMFVMFSNFYQGSYKGTGKKAAKAGEVTANGEKKHS